MNENHLSWFQDVQWRPMSTIVKKSDSMIIESDTD